MRIKSATRYFTAWLAMLAMLFMMAAPSISHAVSAARGELFVEMCGVSGTKLVSISGDTSEPSEPSKPSAPEHCKLCSMHGKAFVPPSGAQPAMFPIDAGTIYPLLFLQSSSPLAVWSPVQSRAPPASA